MAKVYIFTDDAVASVHDNEIQDSFLEEHFGDRTFLLCEDNKSLISNEEEDTVFVQEYFEN